MIPEPLVIGVAGVFVGAVLNQGYTTFKEWRGRRRSGEIVAMILAFALEDYADKCASTRATFADYRSSRGASGEPDASLPILPDFSEKTDWRSLGKKYAADALAFHARVGIERGYVRAMWEHADADEGWSEVAARAVELGVAALKIAQRLRKDFRLDPPPAAPGWDVGEYLAREAEAVRKWREAERRSAAEDWDELMGETREGPAPSGP